MKDLCNSMTRRKEELNATMKESQYLRLWSHVYNYFHR